MQTREEDMQHNHPACPTKLANQANQSKVDLHRQASNQTMISWPSQPLNPANKPANQACHASQTAKQLIQQTSQMSRLVFQTTPDD